MDTKEILSKIIEITTAPVEMERRLANLSDALPQLFGVSFVGIFFWDPHRSRLHLRFANTEHPVLLAPAGLTLAEVPFRDCVVKKIPVVTGEDPSSSRRENAAGPFSFLFSRPSPFPTRFSFTES
jgi:hypothetical protein